MSYRSAALGQMLCSLLSIRRRRAEEFVRSSGVTKTSRNFPTNWRVREPSNNTGSSSRPSLVLPPFRLWVWSQVLVSLAGCRSGASSIQLPSEGLTDERGSERAENRRGRTTDALRSVFAAGGAFVSTWKCDFSWQERRGNS